MNSRTLKHFVCSNDHPGIMDTTLTQPLIELEPEPEPSKEAEDGSTQDITIIVPSLTREQSTESNSYTPHRKRFKSSDSIDEDDSGTEGTAVCLQLPHTMSSQTSHSSSSSTSSVSATAASVTRNISRENSIRERSLQERSQVPRRRPTALFPLGRQELREGGHPAEMVTPEATPVKTNNGIIHIVGLVTISPVILCHTDNNNVLQNNPRQYRRAHSC